MSNGPFNFVLITAKQACELDKGYGNNPLPYWEMSEAIGWFFMVVYTSCAALLLYTIYKELTKKKRCLPRPYKVPS